MITAKQLICGVLGNLATSIWYIPYASNMLHLLRGVKFKNALTVYLARDVIIDNRYPNNIRIGKNTIIAPRAIILAHSYVPKGNYVIGEKERIGDVDIGNNVFIGANSVILPDTVLQDGCYVAAGSVVKGHYSPNNLIAGNPAEIKKPRQYA